MRKLFSTVSLLLLCTGVMLAQQKKVTGRVLDDSGRPVPGATIIIKGSKSGTTTDTDGGFSLNTSTGSTLIVSAIGYGISETKYQGQATLSLTIVPESKILTDVVVTGVSQATSKAKLAFSLTKVDAKQINTVPAIDLSQTLRGKVAGIQISQSEGDDGASVFLRGAKSLFGYVDPLLVVDGFVTNLTLSDLNPQDVESIEVVKGASASALYGTRAEGGVIQVITKKGKNAEGGISVVIDNEVGVNNIQRTPELATLHRFKLDPSAPYGFAVPSPGSFARIVDYKDNGFSVNLHPYDRYYDNTNALLGNKTYYTNFASISASGEKYNAYISFQNQYTGGVAEPIDPNKRKTAKLNLQLRPNSKLELEVNAQYYNDVKPSSAVSSNGQGTFFAATLQYEPFIDLSAKNANGDYKVKPDGWDFQAANLSNPMYEWSKRRYTNNSDNILAGGKIRYKILSNLSVEVMGSINKEIYKNSNLYPIGYQTITPNQTYNNGYLSMQHDENKFINAQSQINYFTKFGDFDFGASAKVAYEFNNSYSFGVSGYDFGVPLYTIDNTRADVRSGNGSPDYNSQTVNYGYYLNLKTSWRDKIFLDVLGRIDQSSRFGDNERTAFFPRVAAAYRITKDFDLGNAITELKARVSYGKAGRLPGYGYKESRATIQSSGAIKIDQLANPDLKRAITGEWELGFDATLFRKLNVTFNYALASSNSDFIQPPSYYPYFGAPIWKNFGKVKSSSIELEVGGNLVEKRNFAWDIGFTFGRTSSEIKELGEGIPAFYDGLFFKDVGVSPFTMYGNKAITSLSELVVDKTTGLVTNAAGGAFPLENFVVNSMGFVVRKDLVGTKDEAPLFLQKGGVNTTAKIGSTQPDFQVGWNNTFTFFKRISVFATLDWKQGGQKYDNTTQYLTFDGRSKVWQDYAESGLPLTFIQSLYNGNAYTSFWVDKSTYLALRELSVSYNVPLPKNNGLLKAARLAFIGRNLFTWTSFGGVNPEGSFEYFPYPIYRTYSAKLTLTF